MPYGARKLTLKQKLLFYSKKEPGILSTPCWVWKKNLRLGYGRVLWKGKLETVHRLAYKEWVGEIKYGLDLDHLCRNRACLNPNHLEPVTHKENVNRGALKKEFCLRGHKLEGNVYFTTRRNGQVKRDCKDCMKIHQKKYLISKRV